MQAIGYSRCIKTLEIIHIDFANLQHPEDLFCHLADKPWAMWLDSCHSTHPDSQFDIIVWQPDITLVTHGENTLVQNQLSGRNTNLADDPLSIIQTIHQQLFSAVKFTKNLSLPFYGGALGYFAYDLGRRFEKMPNLAKQDILQADMAVGFYHTAVLFDRNKKQFYLIAPSEEIQTTLQTITLLMSKTTPQVKHHFALTSEWQANMSEDDYQHKFSQVQNYLLAGDCYQINLAQRFKASYQGDEFSAYLALRTHNQAPFSAFLRFEHSSVLSLSPERFLKLTQDTVETKPIKGTRPRSENISEDNTNAATLMASIKDRAENLMIVDLLRNDLSKVCQPGTVNVPKLFAIESFPAVHHLVSTVEGKLASEFDACDLLRGAFPGGSITGAPKIRAMEIIEELEPHRRNIYCGSIGYISACGNMDTSITIRTLVCENKHIYCWAGGGLVADSKVADEYQETFDKVNKILPILSKR